MRGLLLALVLDWTWGWRGPPGPAQGAWTQEARLDLAREDGVTTQKGGLAPGSPLTPTPRAGPFSRESLADGWGVGENVTCGLAADALWDLAGLGTLCLEIARGGSGSRAEVPDRSLAGTRAHGPRVGRRPRGQLPWRSYCSLPDPSSSPVLFCVVPPACHHGCCPSYQ